MLVMHQFCSCHLDAYQELLRRSLSSCDSTSTIMVLCRSNVLRKACLPACRWIASQLHPCVTQSNRCKLLGLAVDNCCLLCMCSTLQLCL